MSTKQLFPQTPAAVGGTASRRVRALAVTAMLSAAATVLMALDFPIPFLIPPFVKMDFSELPALLAAFALGPASGAAVCLVKNLVNLAMSSTQGVGELCNFLLGAAFMIPAGLLYKKHNSLKGAMIASLAGAAVMAVISLPVNYFLTYPAYSQFLGFPTEAILDLYRAINPSVNTLFEALLWFNVPFTFVKGLCDVLLTFLVYKRLSPVIKKAARQ